MKKTILLFLCVLILSGCSTSIKEETPKKSDSELLEEKTIQNKKLIKDDTCSKLSKEFLDKSLWDDYDRLYGALKESQFKVRLNSNPTYVSSIFDAVTFDHPELFWVDYDYTSMPMEKESYTIVYPTYTYEGNAIEETQKQVDAVVNPLIQKMEKLPNDYEKVKAVYDYVIDRTEYIDKEKNNQNMLSVLLDGEAVCAGYSKSMKYLLDKLSIPNAILLVKVTKEPDEYHVINMVQMDGEYYYLDPTFGDIKIEKSYANYRYAYFGMTSEEMLNIYTPQQEYKKTNAIKDSYFYQEDAYMESYDENKIISLIQRNLKDPNPCLFLKCRNKEVYEQTKETMDSQHIFDLFQAAGYSPSQFQYYYLDDTYCFFINYW